MKIINKLKINWQIKNKIFLNRLFWLFISYLNINTIHIIFININWCHVTIHWHLNQNNH